jgi:hypothetical protein
MNLLILLNHLIAVAVKYRAHLHTCGVCRGERDGACSDAPYYQGELCAAMRLVSGAAGPDESPAERCQYCGAKPAWPVLWHVDGKDAVVYLCESCDRREMLEFGDI